MRGQPVPLPARAAQERASRKLSSHAWDLQLSITFCSCATNGDVGAVRDMTTNQVGGIGAVQKVIHEVEVTLAYKLPHSESPELSK